mgnify:FL=1
MNEPLNSSYGQSGSGTERDRDDPHVPRPREGELPNGDLAVAGDRQLSNRGTVVPAADRPLYELLMKILEDCHVPDVMPADLAVVCDDLVEARGTVSYPDRGSECINGPCYGLSYLNEVRRAIEAYRDREPLKLAAVGCSGSKYEDDEPMPAKERYKGAYWSNKREYGETCADDWGIISAEYAVLDPERPIKYYEKTPDDLRGIPIDSDQRLPNGDGVTTLLDRWALDIYDGLAAWLSDVAAGIDPRDVALEVLLGKSYREPLENRGVFDGLRVPGDLMVSFPFQEVEQAQGGMFEQIDWMGDEVEAATEAVTDGGRSVNTGTDREVTDS